MRAVAHLRLLSDELTAQNVGVTAERLGGHHALQPLPSRRCFAILIASGNLVQQLDRSNAFTKTKVWRRDGVRPRVAKTVGEHSEADVRQLVEWRNTCCLVRDTLAAAENGAREGYGENQPSWRMAQK